MAAHDRQLCAVECPMEVAEAPCSRRNTVEKHEIDFTKSLILRERK